ncbi:unnamed protein product [Rangifer tarandus platyrhynchus]|uniref:Uncharacterized protein n=1 Tax=Rangifer tarandus platyrhynchus TaxID=3082113 RepID=A0AC60A818_RANTA
MAGAGPSGDTRGTPGWPVQGPQATPAVHLDGRCRALRRYLRYTWTAFLGELEDARTQEQERRLLPGKVPESGRHPWGSGQ